MKCRCMQVQFVCLFLLCYLSAVLSLITRSVVGGGARWVDSRVVNLLSAGHLLILLTEYTRKTGVLTKGWH